MEIGTFGEGDGGGGGDGETVISVLDGDFLLEGGVE